MKLPEESKKKARKASAEESIFREKAVFLLLFAALAASFFIDGAVFSFFSRLHIPVFSALFTSTESVLFMAALIIAASAFLFLRRKKSIAGFWAAVAATYIVVFAIKLLAGRPRPFGTEMMSFGLQDFSFPSAHAALSFCLFAFYSRELKGFAQIWLAIGLLISFSRIYISAHYLSDVIAGALIGYFIGSYFAGRK